MYILLYFQVEFILGKLTSTGKSWIWPGTVCQTRCCLFLEGIRFTSKLYRLIHGVRVLQDLACCITWNFRLITRNWTNYECFWYIRAHIFILLSFYYDLSINKDIKTHILKTFINLTVLQRLIKLCISWKRLIHLLIAVVDRINCRTIYSLFEVLDHHHNLKH